MELNRLNTAGNTTGKEDSKNTYGYSIYYHPVFQKQLAILSVFDGCYCINMLTQVCQIDWYNKTRLVPILFLFLFFLFLFFLFSFFLQEACAIKGCLALKQNMTEPKKKKKEKKSKRKQRKRKDKSIEWEAFFLTAPWALTTKKKRQKIMTMEKCTSRTQRQGWTDHGYYTVFRCD